MDVPAKNAVNPWWPNYRGGDQSPSNSGAATYKFYGQTNFPISFNFSLPPYGGFGNISLQDQDVLENPADSTYGTHAAIPNYSWYWTDNPVRGALNMPATLDVEAAILAWGRVDVENLNRFDVNPAGFAIPACTRLPSGEPDITGQCRFFSSRLPPLTPPCTAPPSNSFYRDTNCDGKIESNETDPAEPYHADRPYDAHNYMNWEEVAAGTAAGIPAEPIYCNAVGDGPNAVPLRPYDFFWYPSRRQAGYGCPVGKAQARGTADDLYINGALVTKDFGNTLASQGSTCGQSVCGFNRKTIRYNDRLLTYAPPLFPKSKSQFEMVVYSTKRYFGSGTAAAVP
jgi:hypothetical protein